jgi:hypothetical protein
MELTVKGTVIRQMWTGRMANLLQCVVLDDSQGIITAINLMDKPRDTNLVGTDRVVKGTVKAAQYDEKNDRWAVVLDTTTETRKELRGM